MSDTPRDFCPGCEPDADEFAEFIAVAWCGRHMPGRDGLDDAGVVGDTALTVTNNAWCALLHGERGSGRCGG